jgi:hypothetical protein
MRIAATPIALAVFCLGVTIVPAAAAEHDLHTAPTNHVALQPTAASSDGAEAVAPNCLLPGQIRSFGGLVMVTPRRAVTLAATDCAARGGELIASTAAAD